MNKKFILRLYAVHDKDLIYASFNPCVSFNRYVKTALKSYIANTPIDASVFSYAYELDEWNGASRTITTYYDSVKDAEFEKFLNSIDGNIRNSYLKTILRTILYQNPAFCRNCLSSLTDTPSTIPGVIPIDDYISEDVFPKNSVTPTLSKVKENKGISEKRKPDELPKDEAPKEITEDYDLGTPISEGEEPDDDILGTLFDLGNSFGNS